MSVTARVSLTIEIECASNWSNDTTMDQIAKQAEADVMVRLGVMQREAGARIIGNVRVDCINVTLHK